MANSQTFTFNIKAIADMKDVESNISNIQNALKQLKLPDSMASSLRKNFGELEREISKYQQIISKGIQTKGDANALEKSGKNILNIYDKIVSSINSLDNSALKKAFEDLGGKEVDKLKESINQLQDQLKQQINTKKIIDTTAAKADLVSLKKDLETTDKAASELAGKLSRTTFATFTKNLEAGRLDLAAKNLESINQQAEKLGNVNLIQWAQSLTQAFDSLKNDSDIQSTVAALEQLKSTLDSTRANVLSGLIEEYKNGAKGAEELRVAIAKLISAENDRGHATAQANKELDQIKSRIQYFLGLNNAINLARRAIRGAFDTIKELDKAMTETAVVTNFSVSDMWSQLPEYTKRANELGVTTLAAYEAATLYYQQGLKANEVNALSTETLKMARIAGLDAAEATDRMTNALRGFNMELSAASAQRVDDVYSELAANTASNVDEISTAMTKVASLANNANMEFETTAAFLAQIIETTRESAETAGTALKTVIARFSEVKKLVDEGSLKGQDEEGQLIDVNKVQAALRTANIDMSKYFLGEVGLDDIFMELASKWDSLTTMQQRYIATQAAGSRQQSRFIAMMSDYARTQELVGKAYNANGAAARQFEKTQESLESKLARLKNAWNEFLMGLTNNVIVKGAVDALTMLLNAVNKVTGAFGEGAGFILKWFTAIMAFKGLKVLFSSGGLIEKGLLSLTGGTALGDKLGEILGKGAGASGEKLGEALFGGITKAGKGLWANLGGLGKSFLGIFGKGAGLSQTALGLTGIATALGAIAVAALAARAAYQVWLKCTDEGQIKLATNYAESLDKISNNLQTQANRAQETQKKIKEYNKVIEEAETPKARETAIQNQNDYIASLIKQDATYAQYIKSTLTEKGQIYLTLDSAALAAAVDKIAEGAVKASAYSDIANASVQSMTGNYYNGLLEGVNLNAGTYTGSTTPFTSNITQDFWYGLAYKFLGAVGDYDTVGVGQPSDYGFTQSGTFKLTPEQRAIYANYQAQATAAEISSRNYLSSAATKLISLSGTSISSELANLVSEAFSQSFDLSNLTKDVLARQESNWWGSKAITSQLEAQYTTLYGAAPEKLEKDDLKYAVAQGEIIQERLGNIVPDLINVVSDENGKLLLDVFTGAAEKQIDISQLQEAYNSLSEEQQNAIDTVIKTSDYGGPEEALQHLLNNYNKEVTATEKKFVSLMSKSGFSLGEINGIVKKITRSQQKNILKIADSLTNYKKTFSDIIVNSATAGASGEAGPESQSLIDFTNIIGSLSENPVLMMQALQKAADNATGSVQALAQQLLDLNDPQLSKTNQLQFFLSSDEFEKVNEQVEKLIESNGALTAKNIEELSSSSGTLAALLENDVVSAQGLLNILNDLGDGSLNIFELDDATIDLYNSFYDLENVSARAQAIISNFKFGGDSQDSFNFIQQIIDKLKELQKIGAYGDMEKYFSVFLTQVPKTKAELDKLITSFEKLNENNGASFWTEIFDTKIDPKGHMDMSKVVDAYKKWLSGGEKETGQGFSGFLKKYVADYLGLTEGEVTQDMIDLVMDIFRGHDTGGKDAEKIAKATAEDLVEKYIAGLSSGLSGLDEKAKQELKVRLARMAEQLNLDPEEIKNILQGALESQGITFSDEEITDLLDFSNVDTSKLTQEISTTLGEAFSGLDIEIDKDSIKADNSNIAGEMLKALGTDENGVFSIETLHANIQELVPEVADGSFSPEEWLNSVFAQTGPIPVPITYKNMTKDEDGVWQEETMTVTVEVGDTSALQTAMDTVVQNAPSVLDALAINDAIAAGENLNTLLADLGKVHSVNLTYTAISQAQQAAETLNTVLGKSVVKPVEINPNKTTINVQATDGATSGTLTFTISALAHGGIIKSAAKGTFEPGLALTGEEAPEIIWNGEKGYAYLAGKNGPEINNLQPGDRVFNGEETKAILRRSGISSFAQGGKIHSYLDWGDDGDGKGKGKGKDKDKDKKKTDWKNELDWLYNLVQDIAEYERKANLFSLKYESYLHDSKKTGKDLYKMLQKQLENLQKARDSYEEEQAKRQTELSRLNKKAKKDDVYKYVKYDETDNTVEIKWDKINKLKKGSEKDKETYDKIVEYINKMEEAKSRRDQAEEAVLEIEEQMRELREQIAERYIDFEQRVFDALTASQQSNIDSLSELNDSLNDLNDSILDSIRKEIELQRQIRDNTKTESEIADMEVQLAFLRRDTTGANRAQILELEQQLKEAREEYSDSLLDQSIDRLEESNELARLQRERQIELLQQQLDYEKDNGALWEEVHRLISSAYDSNGKFKVDSELGRLLRETDAWDAMSQAQRDAWVKELVEQAKEVVAYLEEHPPVAEKPTIAEPITQEPTLLDVYQERPKAESKAYEQLTGKVISVTLRRNDRSILEPQQWSLITQQAAEAGQRAAERAEAYNRHLTQQNVKSNSFDININVEKIDSDYSVDRMVDRVKNDIYNSAVYRNVNNLTLLR